ncbi:MAG: adaptor protein MecA [Lachnospiraceae bacterium]|nr:adaptor protein MecA [Lachnospiraceae bacterium]
MKIERINENQIRCTLNRSDLADRQIELSELAYGSTKARRLFQELIQTAAAEVGFDVENMPLMVEAIPMSMDSIVLIVTRVEDPDELDTRFSRFSPSPEEEWSDTEPMDDFMSGLLEGAELLKELIHKDRVIPSSSQDASQSADQPQTTVAPTTSLATVPTARLFSFDSLDAAAHAAAAVGSIILVHSTLYKNPSNDQYYLCLHCGEDEDAFRRTCNTVSEYGTLRHSSAGVLAYCEEHCEILIANRALDKLVKLA